MKKRVTDVTSASKFLAETSLGIAVVVNTKASRHPVEDGSAATMNILLAVHALGLGACWIGSYGSPYEEEVKKILEAPNDWILLLIIALGYPDEKPYSSRANMK